MDLIDEINGIDRRVEILERTGGGAAGIRPFTRTVAPLGIPADYNTDGVDDHVQIKAALDEVSSSGGGTVFVRRGTYTIGAMIDMVGMWGTHLVGEGIESTILMFKNSLPVGAYPTYMFNWYNSNFGSIQNLTLHGNKDNNTANTCGGWFDPGLGGFMRNVLATEFKSTNWYSPAFDVGRCHLFECVAEYNSTTGFYSGAYDGGSYVGCISQENDFDGFLIARRDTRIIDCMASYNGFSGVDIFQASGGVIVKGNTISDNLQGIFLQSTTQNIIEGNHVWDNQYHSIDVHNSGGNIVMGNQIRSEYLAANNNFYGIALRGTSVRNIVSGNNIVSRTTANRYAFGIREEATADQRNIITNNVAINAQTANISSVGTGSINANNIIT